MKVLAIGTSFSQDATTFLHQVAEEQGVALEVVNLYIGGCSLETHWKNMENMAHMPFLAVCTLLMHLRTSRKKSTVTGTMK